MRRQACLTPCRAGRVLAILLALAGISGLAFGGITGKIAGKVVDTGTKEALVGANIVLGGTRIGGITDAEGEFVIINIPPGTYDITASLMGFHPSKMTNVRVQVDLTTRVVLTLTESSVALGEEIVVIAERPIVQRDLTSTSTKVSAEQIRAYPVEDVAGLVNLQAGVVDGHFRGGRLGEVLYLVDGIAVTDLYSGAAGVTAETNSIQELEVISGTFNAEYGQAMSGVVNQVTKAGSERFSGDVSFYMGDYLSPSSDIFMHIGNIRPNAIYDVEASVGGPVVAGSGLTFFVSGRWYNNDGYLYGQRIFLPTDSSNFSSNNKNDWYVQSTGDSAYVPLNFDTRGTLQAKLSMSVRGTDRIKLLFLGQRRDFRNYSHPYKYNPDGTYHNFTRGKLLNVGYTSVFNPTTFIELNGAWFSNWDESYVFADPYDPRYPDPSRGMAASGPAFLTGGAEMNHYHRESRYWDGIVDFVSQVNMQHQVKAGAEGKWHRIWIHNFGVRNDQQTDYKPVPVEFGSSEFAHTTLHPVQYSGYVQDKMEFERLIVNLGLRYDYFNSKGSVLVDQLRLGQEPVLTPAEAESQLSPRIGLAYPITERGVLHVSYGHFFQVPQFDLIFLNPAYNINISESFQVGNPGLKSQRTVAYELGLQQQMSDDIKLDVALFYKDMRNLIGTEVFDIGNGNRYSQYVNRDYGNSRGFTISFEKRHTHGFSGTLDYTFQIAQGNASDPNSVFLDNQTVPPIQSQKQLAPLDWDRRHSLNISATFGEYSNYTVTAICRFGSGLPYTPAYQNQRTGLLNSENKPMINTVDLYATKYFPFEGYQLNVFLKVYNLFDTKNELEVFTDTGRATSSLEEQYAGQPRGINTTEEYYTRPDFYSAPRQVVIGAGFTF